LGRVAAIGQEGKPLDDLSRAQSEMWRDGDENHRTQRAALTTTLVRRGGLRADQAQGLVVARGRDRDARRIGQLTDAQLLGSGPHGVLPTFHDLTSRGLEDVLVSARVRTAEPLEDYRDADTGLDLTGDLTRPTNGCALPVPNSTDTLPTMDRWQPRARRRCRGSPPQRWGVHTSGSAGPHGGPDQAHPGPSAANKRRRGAVSQGHTHRRRG
jgi:hypothetical protein